jgi:hypothetical protein
LAVKGIRSSEEDKGIYSSRNIFFDSFFALNSAGKLFNTARSKNRDFFVNLIRIEEALK